MGRPLLSADCAPPSRSPSPSPPTPWLQHIAELSRSPSPAPATHPDLLPRVEDLWVGIRQDLTPRLQRQLALVSAEQALPQPPASDRQRLCDLQCRLRGLRSEATAIGWECRAFQRRVANLAAELDASLAGGGWPRSPQPDHLPPPELSPLRWPAELAATPLARHRSPPAMPAPGAAYQLVPMVEVDEPMLASDPEDEVAGPHTPWGPGR